jgi:hypothetical protein
MCDHMSRSLGFAFAFLGSSSALQQSAPVLFIFLILVAHNESHLDEKSADYRCHQSGAQSKRDNDSDHWFQVPGGRNPIRALSRDRRQADAVSWTGSSLSR